MVDKAGPSRETPAHVSFRDLFEHLELARHQRDAKELQSFLTSRKGKLTSCLQPFPSADIGHETQDKATLRQQLCHDIARTYSLTADEASDQLDTFLLSEGRDLESESNPPASPTKRREAGSRAKTASPATKASDLLDAFNIFYFEERMYLLRTVSSLIRITEDVEHPYYDLASSVLALFADEKFAMQCITHYKVLTELSLSEYIRQQARYSSLWAKQILREQFGLLEIVFLLFYGRLTPSPSSVLAILGAVQDTQAGTRQANSGFFDDEASETVVCISHLLVLIAIESLGLEEVMDGLDLSTPTSTRLVQDPQLLRQVLDQLEKTGSDPMQSPVLVAWALVLHRLEDALVSEHEHADRSQPLSDQIVQLTDALSTDDRGPSMWRRLAQAAFVPEMQLFEIMMSMLASPLLTSSNGASTPAVAGPSALAYRAVFKGLLLSITELVKPEFLPDFDALVSLWEATFGSGIALELSPAAIDGVAALCDQFWQIDSQYESRRTTLDTARRRWPVSFRPLVRMLKALSGHARVDVLASYPSLLDDRSSSEVEERACTSVFEYLSTLPTFAQVLPMGANAPGAPFETMEGGDYTSVTYRVTRSIRIPGTQVRLAPGTTGSTISELGKAPVVVLWSPLRPVSAWKVMRDVLACFPPQTPTLAGGDNDAKVFQDNQSSMNFERLAPAEIESPWEQLASEMLDLFSSIVSASPDLAWSLLAQLEGRDLGEDDTSIDYEPDELEEIQQEKLELAQAKSLSTISLQLLSHALNASPVNVQLVRSANKLLTVLLPYEADIVWQEIRSSNVLFGSPGTLPYLSALRVSSTSALVTHEVARASYSGLLSLLDFHIALFYDLRRSFSTCTAEALEIKTGVLLRSLSWVFESIWPEYQSWRYVRLADRLHIGQKCTLLLETVLSERSWQGAPHGPGSLFEAVECNLITRPSMLALAPLITCLGNGQQLLDQLNRAGRQNDILLAEQWICSSLRLASLVVSRRREFTLHALQKLATLPTGTAKKAVQARIELGLFERLFFDHTIVANRAGAGRKSSRIELANAVVSYVLIASTSQINVEATRLITLLLRSVADLSAVGKQAPGLIGHLGTMVELEATLRGLVGLVVNAQLDTTLRTDVWTMLAAIVDTQPALGTLLLTGRHLAKSTESRLTQAGEKDKTYGQALSETALDAACAVVLRWKEVVESDAQLLEAVLRFLDVAWSHAAEHVAAFDTIRTKPVFFQALAEIVANSLEAPSTDAQMLVDDSQQGSSSMCHESVASYAHVRMCQARALRLLERDIQLGNLLKSKDTGKASLNAFLSILTNSEKLLRSVETSFAMPCDPNLRIMLELKLAEMFPSIELPSLRHAQRKDDFDMERRYGDDYHYSLASFRRKLEGLLGSMNRIEARELGIVEEGLLSIMTMNLEWSCIDVQNSVLEAWKLCIESTMGRIVAEAMSSKQMHALERSAITTWTRLATIAADEGREGTFMRGAHATRLSLLSSLLELAWGHGESKDASSQDQVVQAASICGRLLVHPMFSIEDSLKGTLPPTFHRDALEMVLLATTRIRSLMRKDSQPNQATVERHTALHLSIDLYCRQAVQALRIIMEAALRLLQTGQIQTEMGRMLEDDFDMLVSIFEMTTRSDVGADAALWLPLLQESSLLQTAMDLVSRAPIVHFDAMSDKTTNTAHHIMFMGPLLSMLLAIASQPASSEQLALQGVLNGLTSNTLSDALERGQVSALLLSGDPSPSHACWTTMLRIVVALIDNLDGASDSGNWTGASGRFVETDVQGFVRVYYQQIERALDLTQVQKRLGSLTNTSDDDDMESNGVGALLSIGQLEELAMVARLLYCLARAEREGMQNNELAKKAASVLQPLVHLLQHPRELCSLLGWDRENEETRLAGERMATTQVRQIVSVLIAALWTHTQCSTVLCREKELWPGTTCAVIRPTTRTTSVQTASLGTLLDLASYLTDHVRSSGEHHQSYSLLEQTLGLAATQLALWASGKSTTDSNTAQLEQMARQEIEAGISRDLVAAIRAASTMLPTADGLSGLLVSFVETISNSR